MKMISFHTRPLHTPRHLYLKCLLLPSLPLNESLAVCTILNRIPPSSPFSKMWFHLLLASVDVCEKSDAYPIILLLWTIFLWVAADLKISPEVHPRHFSEISSNSLAWKIYVFYQPWNILALSFKTLPLLHDVEIFHLIFKSLHL